METIIKLRASELDAALMEKVKALFAGKDTEIVLSFSEEDFDEKRFYKRKIEQSIENIEKGKNLVSFTGSDFEKIAKVLEDK